MPRNQFQTLLRFWHFSDNESPDAATNRLHKIDCVVSFFNSKYKEILKPDKYIAVDETMIPFRGRLGFRQYIHGNRHKYGVKLFKMREAIRTHFQCTKENMNANQKEHFPQT